jgi:hypothetical protein
MADECCIKRASLKFTGRLLQRTIAKLKKTPTGVHADLAPSIFQQADCQEKNHQSGHESGAKSDAQLPPSCGALADFYLPQAQEQSML